MSNRGNLKIISCNSGLHLAEKVIENIKTKGIDINLTKNKEERFKNSEIINTIEENVRGSDLYIFQDVENKSNNYSVDDNFSSLKSLLEASKRSGAVHRTVVIPSFPYARQDKKKGRQPISAKRVARELEKSYADQIITLDLHNEAIEGFFDDALLENLHASKLFRDYMTNNEDIFNLENTTMASIDMGGAERARHYAQKLQTGLAVCYKRRDYSKTNTVEETKILGDVKGRDVVFVDDLIDTAGSIDSGSRKAKEEGAKSIYVMASLCLFNDPATKRINSLYEEGIINGVIGTDAVYKSSNFLKNSEWYKEVSVAKLISKVIMNLNENKSISELLK